VTGLLKVPLTEVTLMVKVASAPGFTVCVLGVPATPKLLVPTLTPVPESVATCVVVAELSVTVTAAVKLVGEAGVKVTVMLQVAVAASVLPQVVPPAALAMAKSAVLAPVSAMLVMFNVALPVLESVRFCAAEVVLTV
jgi:hypothetical protein